MKIKSISIKVLKRVIPLAVVALLALLVLLLLFFDSLGQAVFDDATESMPGTLEVRRFSPSWSGITLSGVKWTLDSKDPVFEASQVKLDISLSELMNRDWYKTVRHVQVEKPGLRVSVDSNGNVNLLSLLSSASDTPTVDLSAIRTIVEFDGGWILYNDRRDAGFLYELSDWTGRFALTDGESLKFISSGHPNGSTESLLQLDGKVALNEPEFAADLLMKEVKLDPFTGFPGFGAGLTYVRGTVDASVRASGRGENWTEVAANLFLVGDMKLADGAFRSPSMPASFTGLGGKAELLGDNVSTEDFVGRFADIGFEMVGEAGFGRDGEVDARVSTERFPISKLGVLVSDPLPVTGEARADVSASGPLEHLLLTGSLYGYNLEAENQKVHEARTDFLKTDAMVYLSNMKALTPAGELAGEGWVFLGDEMRVLFDLHGDDTRPDELFPGIAQSADFRLKVLGDPVKPVLYGQGSLAGLGDWAQGLSQASGKFILSGDNILLYDGAATSGGSVVNLEMGAYDTKAKRFSGLVSAMNFRAEDVPGVQGVSGVFTGNAVVDADLSGQSPRLEAQAFLESGSFQSGDLAVTDARGEAFLDGTQVVIPWAQSNFRGSDVEIAGVFDTESQALNFAMESPNFNLSSLGLAPEQANIAGTVQGHLGGELGLYGYASSARGRAAVSGFQRSNGRMSGVAWVDGTEQGVDLQTVVVADGTPSNLNLEYTGQVSGPQLAGLGPLNLFGGANLVGRNLHIRPTLLSALDAPSQSGLYPLTTYSGAAYSFFGPLMSGPLEKVVIEESPFPTTRSLTLAGDANLGSGALNMQYQLRAAGLEDAPFPAGMEALPFELVSGYGQADGKVVGTLTNPKVESDLLFPWLLLSDKRGARLSVGARARLELGKTLLNIPSLTLAQSPYDSRLYQETAPVPTEGLLGVSGVLRTDQSFDLRLKTEGFSTGVLAFFAPSQFRPFIPSGELATNSLHLWGTPALPSLAGRVDIERGGLMLAGEPYPLESMFVDFSSQGGEVSVRELGLQGPGLEVSGSLKRRANGQLEGSIEARDIDLTKLHRFDSVLAGIDGRADLIVELGGRLPSAPLAKVGFRSRDLTWNPGVLGGRSREVAIEKLVLGVFEEDRLAEGVTIAPTDEGIFVDIPASGFAFQRSERGLTVTASGAVNVPGGLVAENFKTFASMADYFASPLGPDFGRSGEPFQFAIRNLTTREGAILLGRRTRGLRVAADLSMALEGQWWRDHKTEAGDSLPHYQVAMEKFEFESGLGGRRSGFGLEGPANLDYQREGQAGYVSLEDFQLGFFREEPNPEAPEEGERAQPITTKGGLVEAQGKLALTRVAGTEPNSEFTLHASDIPLANMAFLLPDTVPLSGTLESLDFVLNGVLPSPHLKVRTLVDDLQIGPVVGMKLDGSLVGFQSDKAYRIVVGEVTDVSDEKVTLTFADDDVASHGAHVDGEADIRWIKDTTPNPGRLELFAKNLTVSPDSPLNLTAALVDKNLAVLASIVPGKVTATGTLNGSVSATGTLQRPEFEGEATLVDGRFDSQELGRFEDLNLDAKLTRITREEAVDSEVLRAATSGFLTRFNLHDFSGTLGGEGFFAKGIAEFAGLAPTLLNLRATGSSLPVRIPKLFTGTMDMDLEIGGNVVTSADGFPVLRPELSGLLVFPNGEFKIPLGSATAMTGDEDGSGAPTTPAIPLDVALDLSLGSEFFVSALNSRVRTVGELQLRAFDGAAKVFGSVALSRGTLRIPFYDASFRLRQGLAIFDGPFIPRLEDVEAVADLGGYRVTARANGRYPDTFSLQLYSDPPLPQSELSRIAVLGGLPSAITGSQPDQSSQGSGSLGTLGTTGVSFLSGILTNRLTEQIGNLLFLSELSFDYIPPATYAIKLAKSLDPNDRFLLTLTRIIRGNGESENLFGVEWRFTRTFLVRTAFDELARPRFWLQSINRF